ncbi:AAA family ATPase [Dyadobacter sp. Leaf189]|uniref:AAA family ATPase n=1 Tax=Dyadobacter sp. Leaf189 TaxID=1736295 RepID=UPI00138F4B1F|nr:AAA family ATPase [Dyadobacter sp. Leaf189]
MRLRELSIHNFRGFGSSSSPINFDGDLLLFFGPNGFGKTSISEAIEWLFYGSTKRRERGDKNSKREHADSYKNVHAIDDVYVEATVSYQGNDYKLRRKLEANETSITFVDGIPALFASIGLSPVEAVYPIIAQNGLQSIIHSSPKDRRDAVCAALGLDELVDLKSSLESARSSLQRTPPNTVILARKELSGFVSGLAQIDETRDLAKRWQQSPMQVSSTTDIKTLLAAANALSKTQSPDVENALIALRTKRQSIANNVLNTSTVKPLQNYEQSFSQYRDTASKLQVELLNTIGKIQEVLKASVKAFNIALLNFWRMGLGFASDEICPLCEQDTLTKSKQEELNGRIKASSEATAAHSALNSSISSLSTLTTRLISDIGRLGINGLTPDERTKLVSLFPSQSLALQDFLIVHDDWVNAKSTINSLLEQITNSLTDLAVAVTDPQRVLTVVESLNSFNLQFETTSSTVNTAYKTYINSWLQFDLVLQEIIASDTEIAKIDSVGKSLKNINYIKLITRYNQLLVDTQNIIRQVESKILAEQTSLLDERGTIVKDLYDRLNIGAQVGFHKMEPGNDNLKLHASSFGKIMHAASMLSECQLNCLGLATFLMRANSNVSPFGFIVLDDPVQSMDDAHAESFMSDIVPHLLDDHNKQVIILSHAKKISERLNALNQHRSTRVYHFEKYEQTGPILTEQVEMAQKLSQIKDAMKGNEDNRKFAVDRIRVLAEALIRRLYEKVNSAPVPSTLDTSSAKPLLALFQSIPGTTQQEHAGLKDTISFADPAHHTQVGYATPVQQQISPHVSRLETMIKKYDL